MLLLEDIGGKADLRSPHVINACDIVRSEHSAIAGPVTSFLAKAPQTAALLITFGVTSLLPHSTALKFKCEIMKASRYLFPIFHTISFPSS